jgi:phage gpG-like protein
MKATLKDMRKIWPKVADELDRIVELIFHSEGGATVSGQWAELSSKYAQRKHPDRGILRRTDRLFTSLTRKHSGDATFIVRRDGFTRGTKVPYAKYHQSGTRKMPARPIYDFRENHARRMRSVLREQLQAYAVSLGFEVS